MQNVPTPRSKIDAVQLELLWWAVRCGKPWARMLAEKVQGTVGEGG